MEKLNFQRISRFTKVVLRALGIFTIKMYTYPAFVLWFGVILFPLRLIKAAWYWKLESAIFKILIRFIGAWVWLVGYKIEELGDDLQPCYGQNCLLLVNHQSTADVPMLMGTLAFKENGVLESTMWIISSVFRYTTFGLVSWLRGDFFISQGKDVRETQLINLGAHLKSAYVSTGKKWIVLFPEGGFLSKRKESSLKFARKYGYRETKNVTLPRVGAASQILETLSEDNLKREGLEKESIKWVIDVTLAYPEGNPIHITSGYTLDPAPPACTRVHYRRYPVEAVPKDKLTEWLFERWSEKEDMLEEFYKTGKFVSRPNYPPQKAGVNERIINGESAKRYPLDKYSYLNILFLHIFFLLFSAFTYVFVQNVCYYFGEGFMGQTSILLAVPEH